MLEQSHVPTQSQPGLYRTKFLKLYLSKVLNRPNLVCTVPNFLNYAWAKSCTDPTWFVPYRIFEFMPEQSLVPTQPGLYRTEFWNYAWAKSWTDPTWFVPYRIFEIMPEQSLELTQPGLYRTEFLKLCLRKVLNRPNLVCTVPNFWNYD